MLYGKSWGIVDWKRLQKDSVVLIFGSGGPLLLGPLRVSVEAELIQQMRQTSRKVPKTPSKVSSSTTIDKSGNAQVTLSIKDPKLTQLFSSGFPTSNRLIEFLESHGVKIYMSNPSRIKVIGVKFPTSSDEPWWLRPHEGELSCEEPWRVVGEDNKISYELCEPCEDGMHSKCDVVFGITPNSKICECPRPGCGRTHKTVQQFGTTVSNLLSLQEDFLKAVSHIASVFQRDLSRLQNVGIVNVTTTSTYGFLEYLDALEYSQPPKAVTHDCYFSIPKSKRFGASFYDKLSLTARRREISRFRNGPKGACRNLILRL